MQVAEQHSSLTYLRLLQSSRATLSNLVDDLKAINYKSLQGVKSFSSITATLDQNLDDLFVSYLESSRYIEKEVKSLQELYSSLLYKYNGFHVISNQFFSESSRKENQFAAKCSRSL
jgi:exocyst complex component 5